MSCFIFFLLFFNIFQQKSGEAPSAASPKSPGISSRHLSHIWAQTSISLWDHSLMFNKLILGPFPTSHLDSWAMTWRCKCLRTCTCITLLDRYSCECSGHRTLRTVILLLFFVFIIVFFNRTLRGHLDHFPQNPLFFFHVFDIEVSSGHRPLRNVILAFILYF